MVLICLVSSYLYITIGGKYNGNLKGVHKTDNLLNLKKHLQWLKSVLHDINVVDEMKQLTTIQNQSRKL